MLFILFHIFFSSFISYILTISTRQQCLPEKRKDKLRIQNYGCEERQPNISFPFTQRQSNTRATRIFKAFESKIFVSLYSSLLRICVLFILFILQQRTVKQLTSIKQFYFRWLLPLLICLNRQTHTARENCQLTFLLFFTSGYWRKNIEKNMKYRFWGCAMP